LAILRKEIHQS